MLSGYKIQVVLVNQLTLDKLCVHSSCVSLFFVEGSFKILFGAWLAKVESISHARSLTYY